jgi:hypothetical protein
LDICRVWASPKAKQILIYIIWIDQLALVLYVDDLFFTGSEKLIVGSKVDIVAEFEMKDIGMMHYFLGLEVW